MRKILQISMLLHSCSLWNWFVCSGFVTVLDFRLLIIRLIACAFSKYVAVSNFRLLMINLIGFLCSNLIGFPCSDLEAVSHFRLFIIRSIDFTSGPWYGGVFWLLCWWWEIVWRRKCTLQGGMRLPVEASVNVHSCSLVESCGWGRWS